MIKIDGDYTDFYDDTDGKFPYGKAVSASTPDSVDGTPWRALFFNDLIGARQAIFKKAFAGKREPSNQPDNAESSDLLDALMQILNEAFLTSFFSATLNGEECVLPWEKFGLTYDANKTFAAWVTADSKNEPLFFATECQPDGLHIFPRKLENGKFVPIVSRVKWGNRKWGEWQWGTLDGGIKANILLRETREVL